MARTFRNTVRQRRELRGWSQAELARAAGLSRPGVSAIESGRLVPSTAAALAIAAALGCKVEEIFRLGSDEGEPGPTWAWEARRESSRYWVAEIGGARRLFPVESTAMGVLPHDGVAGGETLSVDPDIDASRTLVLASCDPAVGLLANALARKGVRLIPFLRSSRAALALLERGLVHVAGVHLAREDEVGGNASRVRAILGDGFRVLRIASWEEGVVVAPRLKVRSVRGALRSRLRWVGREGGSAARECLDELLEGRARPRRIASDHRGVAEAVKHGWADAGLCLRISGEEAGLDFLGVRREAFDLVYPFSLGDDRRLTALLETVRSESFRRALGEVPGFDSRMAGEVHDA